MKTKRLGFLALATFLIGAPMFLGAAEFAIEPFDGVTGTPIAGTGSGAGWEAAWTGGNVLTYDAGLSFIASGSNSVGIVTSSNQSIKAGGSPAGQNNDPRRVLSSSYTVGADTGAGEQPVIYLSYLFQNSGSVPAGHEFRVALTNGTTVVASFGKEINSNWRLRDSDENISMTTAYTGNFFCVLKLAYDAPNNQTIVTAYRALDTDANIDLTNLATYPVTATLSTPGKLVFDSVQLLTHNSTTAKFDEIRIGTDLANVSATPDPLLVAADSATFITNNAPAFVDLTVSNAGTTNDLVITAVTPGGTDAAAFAIDPLNLPMNIAPGRQDVIPVDFSPYPTYQPTYSATLEIVSNESASPRIITYQITNNPDPWIESAATINLTNNGAATAYSIPFSNIGFMKTLSISSVTVDGINASTISGLNFPASLNPGQDGTIDFTFNPDSGLGLYDVTLTIASDDPATPSKIIDVFIKVAEPLIEVSSEILNFGNLANEPGATNLTLTVTNAGDTLDLNILDTTAITGSGAFTLLSPALPVAVTPGASTDLVIRFNPGTAGGRFSGALTIQSDDSNNTVPTVRLEAFVDPAGTVAARFDFDPSQAVGATLDVDGSGGLDWTTGDLTDEATGIGAISQGNQTASNRVLSSGLNGSYLNFSCARESDAQTPALAGGSNETTWTTFTVTPDAGGGSIDFTGGTAVVDTYANTELGNNTAANWTLYYSTDGGTNWTSLGTLAGKSTAVIGTFGPLGLSWDLTSIGNQTGPVEFILDPVATGNTNGTVTQRGVGFDNLVITAGSVTPGSGGDFSSWASGFGIPSNPDYDGSDFDGIPALVEYALGLSPLVAEAPPGTLTGTLLSFTKGAEAVANGDVAYTIEISQTLASGSWATVTPDENSGSTISYTLPSDQGKLFARLLVSQVAP